jgi:hypothetical protein
MNNFSEDKKNQLLVDLHKAQSGVAHQICMAKDGEEALDGLSQLYFIQSKLSEMEQSLLHPELGKITKSKLGICHLVVDTWPLDNALGELICNVEYRYVRLK